MSGMNVIFHFASAAALLALVWLLLRAQRQRDLLRDLLRGQSAATTAARIQVEAPAAFLARYAAALGVPFENEAAKDLAPARIQAGPLTDLFLRAGLGLIRCKDGPGSGLAVELHVGREPTEASAETLAAALGGGVQVRIQHIKEQ